ncbi:metal-dependent hydrolase [Salinibaculum rarum]|uniref:metal-dependent hydrolase n=1 Tax=Salinibaculum rarum TaxID=3058903 RepID=UPI00265FF72F|nr:metal-dependent hydrolase [Salinibaculum sp. KK48]
MFVGHGLLAFAIAASVASRRGWPTDRALAVGIVAGLFGTVPDIDMLYAVFGLASGAEGLFAASDAFWAAASLVHRAVTHSLVLGTVAAVGFAAWRARTTALSERADGWLAVAGLSFALLVGAVFLTSGPLAAAIVVVFLLGGLGIVTVAGVLDFGPRIVLGTALLGLLSHPFGDLFTGTPPQFLYPLDATIVADRILLHPDPTLHLLGAFFVELAVIWAALLTVARLRGWQLLPSVRPRAALGVGYAAAVFAIPAPTLQVSWPFVFSVLGVGLVAVPVGLREQVGNRWYTAVTGLTAVTLAGFAYAVAYLLVG